MTWTKHYDANGNLMGLFNLEVAECVCVKEIYKKPNEYAVEAWGMGPEAGSYWLAICQTEAEAIERMQTIMEAMQ